MNKMIWSLVLFCSILNAQNPRNSAGSPPANPSYENPVHKASVDSEKDRILRMDRKYMHSLAINAGNSSISIDFTDPIQRRFVMNRISESAQKSPDYRQIIAALMANACEKNIQQDQASQKALGRNFATRDHFLLKIEGNNGYFEASAIAMYSDNHDLDSKNQDLAYQTLEYTFIDAGGWDENWNQVGNLGWNEIYSPGSVIAMCHGPFPVDQESLLIISSFQMYVDQGELHATLIFQLGQALQEGHLERPIRTSGNKGRKIVVCLENSTRGCDYEMKRDRLIQLPFSGSVKLSDGYDFESFPKEGSSLKLSGTGGVNEGGTAEFVPHLKGRTINTFFSHRVEGGDEYIDWHFESDDGDFGSDIFEHLDTVHWFLKIKVRLEPRDARETVTLTLDINSYSDDPNVFPTSRLLPFTFK